MWKWTTHPYTITGISECGNVYVKDIWGKAHKRSVPPNHLKPYKDVNYISSDEDVEHPVMEKISVIKSSCHQQFPSSKVSVVKDETQDWFEYACQKYTHRSTGWDKKEPYTNDHQWIMTWWTQSRVSGLHHSKCWSRWSWAAYYWFHSRTLVEFHPLNYVQRKRISTEVFKLDFNINQPEVQYVKCGSTLIEKSSHLVKMPGDGHHFFCSISFCLTGNQFQHYKIHQHLCDFIESEGNLSKLRAFLGHHKTGKDYVLSSKMRQQAWATEVEMISLALLSGRLRMLLQPKLTATSASGNVANPTPNSFNMDNGSGCHFDAVVGPSNFLSSRILPSLFLL